MRKPLTLLILLVISFVGSMDAQTTAVPNAKMDDWHAVGSYEDPVDWNTSNLATAFGAQANVTKSTDAITGFAAKLESVPVPFIGAIPGAMGTGVLDLIELTFDGGFPLSMGSPEAIIGYFKFAPQGGDSCLVGAVLFHWDAINLKRDTVALAEFVGHEQSVYTSFSAQFDYILPGVTPDSAIVYVSSAYDYLAPHVGSIMYVDNIDFTNTVGVFEIPQIPMELFPNPSNETVDFQIPRNIAASHIIIANAEGKIFEELPLMTQDKKQRINTSAFPDGVYFLHVKNEEGKIKSSAKFIVQH